MYFNIYSQKKTSNFKARGGNREQYIENIECNYSIWDNSAFVN